MSFARRVRIKEACLALVFFLSALDARGQAQRIFSHLSDQLDVTIASPSNAQVLQYNGTKWVNATLSLNYEAPLTFTLPLTRTVDTITIAAATTSAAGSMSSADKTKLDAISGTNTGDQTVPANTTNTTSQWFNAYNASTGAFTKAQPAFTDVSGAATTAQLPGGATLDTEWDTAAEINTATTDDDFLTLTGTQTATNKTFTSPKIGTGILDTNGNPMFAVTATASAVNGFTFTNAATANPATVTMAATGSDSNITIALTTKGTGVLNLGSTNATVDASGILTIANSSSALKFGAGYSLGRHSTRGLIGIYNNTGIFTSDGSYFKIGPQILSMSGGGDANYDNSATDVGIKRNAAGVLEVNTGTALSGTSNAASIKALTFLPVGTATTCTGGTIGTGSKSNAGFVTATTTGTSTIVITFPVTAPTGWSVMGTNLTTGTGMFQTAKSTTTATISGATTSGDVVQYIAIAY